MELVPDGTLSDLLKEFDGPLRDSFMHLFHLRSDFSYHGYLASDIGASYIKQICTAMAVRL